MGALSRSRNCQVDCRVRVQAGFPIAKYDFILVQATPGIRTQTEGYINLMLEVIAFIIDMKESRTRMEENILGKPRRVEATWLVQELHLDQTSDFLGVHMGTLVCIMRPPPSLPQLFFDVFQ